jgi:hypothetical protein
MLFMVVTRAALNLTLSIGRVGDISCLMQWIVLFYQFITSIFLRAILVDQMTTFKGQTNSFNDYLTKCVSCLSSMAEPHFIYLAIGPPLPLAMTTV